MSDIEKGFIWGFIFSLICGGTLLIGFYPNLLPTQQQIEKITKNK